MQNLLAVVNGGIFLGRGADDIKTMKYRKFVLLLPVVLGLFVIFWLVFGVLGKASVNMSDPAKTGCKIIINSRDLSIDKNLKLAPGSYQFMLTGKRVVRKDFDLKLGLFDKKTIACPSKPATDQEIISSLRYDYGKQKIASLEYFENGSWFVAYLSQDGSFGGATERVVGYYDESFGWKIFEKDRSPTGYGSAAQSVQDAIESDVTGE